MIGCVLGGLGVFASCTLLMVSKDPASLLASTSLGALLTGLTFLRFFDVWWRFLTPPSGALLVAASLRFFALALVAGTARWSEFFLELMSGPDAMLSFGGAIFWTAWVVLTLLGWYLQIGSLVGLYRPKPLVPAWLSESCLGLLEMFGVTVTTTRRTNSNSSLLSRSTSENPLLATEEPLLGPVDKLRSLPELLTVTKEAGKAALKEDYRPEVALLTSVITVVSLNSFLANQPILFLGHGVLMSLAFLPLASAGMVSYASTSLLLPRLFGPRVGSVTRRHVSHGVFNGLALACALGGYACIFANHRQTGASQFGLDALNNPARFMHVVIGYTVLLLLLIQAASGIARLYFVALRGQVVCKFHGVLGRMVYCLAAVNQLIAYTFPGLVPVWATPLLAATLIVAVGSTLFFLQEKKRMDETMKIMEEERQRSLEERRLSLEKLISNGSWASTGTPGGATSARCPRLVHTDSSVQALLAAERSLEVQHSSALLLRTFSEWHRCIQKQRLEEAAEALEGQDRLVQFLSSEMVEAGVGG